MTKIKNRADYQKTYTKSLQNPQQYWAEVAETFSWHKKWHTIQEGNFRDGNITWFAGGQLNITENCLDRHLPSKGNKTALLYVPNDPQEKAHELSYRKLHQRVCTFSNVLKEHGIKKGDRVCLYMSMTPELMIGILACARIGAIHSVIFGGFSAQALAGRIQDCQATLLITSDGSLRGNKIIPLKDIADEALQTCPTVNTVIVHQRACNPISMAHKRDYWWHELISSPTVQKDCPPTMLDSEDPLFILYTSGSTGSPKGLLHTTAGYMAYSAHTFENVFQTNEESLFWCTADIGWITGHTYTTYGPLLNGATTVMFEGVPTWPDAGRFWQICQQYKVTHFYTAPTAIRALQAQGLDFVTPYDLSHLKVLGTVGEPINEEAWHWYHKNIGKGVCPIVDTWWQTETGGIMISPLAGITESIPSFAATPQLGIAPALLDSKGALIEENDREGKLCIAKPWPGMARTIYNDHQRFMNTYFSDYPGHYFTGDGAYRDRDGNYRITGRVDDIIVVSGHNIGTAEVEDAINLHPQVVESAVVGFPHEIKGQGICAYLICKKNTENNERLHREVKALVDKSLGALARPDKIQMTSGLPKTRSGKIMRRILKKIAAGDADELGDVSTLLNPEILAEIITYHPRL